MSGDSTTSKIGQVAIFEQLSDAELKKIAKAGSRVHLPANWSLIWEKTPADKAYIVLDGELSVRKNGKEIAQLGAGDIVGETAIVNHKLRNASVVSTTEVDVLHFTREAVEQLCRDIPTFSKALESAAEGRVGTTAKSSD